MLFLFAACVTGGNREVLHGSHNNRAERVVRDSIYLRDSVFVAMRADTVFYEKQRTVFRDRLSIDTFIVCDTLFKERVVTVEKVVKQYPPSLVLAVGSSVVCGLAKRFSAPFVEPVESFYRISLCKRVFHLKELQGTATISWLPMANVWNS